MLHFNLFLHGKRINQSTESEAQKFAVSQESKPEPSTWQAGILPLNHRLLLIKCELLITYCKQIYEL